MRARIAFIKLSALALGILPGTAGSLLVTARAEAAPSRPDWCGNYKSPGDAKAKWIDGYLQSEGWSDRVRNYIALGACDKPDDAARQKDVDKWRTRYSAELGGTAADFNAMVALYMNPAEAEKQKGAFCSSFSSQDAVAGKLNEAIANAAGCGGTNFGVDRFLWQADKAAVSEVTRAVIVSTCVNNEEAFGQKYKRAVLCLPDVATPLDRSRFDVELNAPRYNTYGKVRLREVFGAAKNLAEGWRQRTTTLGNQDPGMKKLFFDAPNAAIRTWQADYQSHKEQLDAAFDIEEKLAANESAQKGCSTKLRTYLTTYLNEKKPKNDEEARRVLIDNVGFPLLHTLMACDILDGNSIASVGMKTALEEIPGDKDNKKRRFRHLKGPRYAAYWAAVDAFADISADKKKMPFDDLPAAGDGVDFMRLSVKGLNGLMWGAKARGIIGTAQPKGDKILITFKKEGVKVWEQECHTDYHKIEGFENGHILFGTTCPFTGKFHVDMVSEDPIAISSTFAGGLKPGQTMYFYSNRSTTPREGFPVEVYTDKDRKNLVNFLGMKLDGAATATPEKAAAPAKTKKKKKK